MDARSRAERWTLGALGLVGAVTAAWWALALWPVAGDPQWLQRAREVCFGAGESGLPDAAGWMLLVGQPLGMVGLLAVGWGRTLRSALAGVASGAGGRAALAAVVVAAVAGLGAAGARVAEASEAARYRAPEDELPPETYPRIDRPAPEHALVDQHGRARSLADLRGRPVLVTFAFGHCSTVCPVVVRRVVEAREALREAMDPAVVVLTLDPWRDTPGRLPHMAHAWDLPEDAWVLSGEVEAVQAALDAWQVPRSRDPTTGDIVHPALVYLVDREGTVAYASTGGPAALVELAGRMEE